MGKVADREGMRRACSQRLHEVVDRVVETADLATVEKVLSMADPFSGMGVAMHQAVTTVRRLFGTRWQGLAFGA